MSDIFEEASRKAIRFSSSKGLMTVEDLWNLPLTSTANRPNLDDLAKAHNKILKETEEDSFVLVSSNKNSTDQLKMDVLKHIIAVKLSEREAANKAKEKKEQRQLIMQIMEQKKLSDLEGKSTEELQKMLDELG